MATETESSIKVVIRTRPTQNFASKIMSIDSLENVSLHIYNHHKLLY